MYHSIYYRPKSSKQQEQDLSMYERLLNFSKRINPDKRERFYKIKDDQKFSIDIAASAISTIFEIFSPPSDLSESLLNCCRDIMFHRGYVEESCDDIQNLFNKSGADETEAKNIITVVGCQTPDIIKNRAMGAAHLFYDLAKLNKKNCSVIFSGLTTGQDIKKKIQNEYKELRKNFVDHLESLNWDRERVLDYVTMIDEDNSITSGQNIKKILEETIVTHYKSCKLNLFIVSSNFHLIRLSQEVDNLLGKDEIKSLLKKNNIIINNIYYFSSEVYSQNQTLINDKAYTKALFFEIYNYFYERDIFV